MYATNGITISNRLSMLAGRNETNAVPVTEYSGERYFESFITQNYTVSFVANNGTSIPNQTVVRKALVTEPSEVTKEGYTLIGWFTSQTTQNDTTKWDFTSDRVKSNLTLYAGWTPIQYTLWFDPNGGACDVGTKECYYGEKYGELPTAERTGFDFAGWYDSEEDGLLVNSETVYTVADDITLYAYWIPHTFTVTFNANGGEVDQENKQVEYESCYGTLPIPRRPGYEFVAWYTQAASGDRIDDDTIVYLDNDITLYAHWTEAEYTVYFDANGGTVQTSEKQVTYNDKFGQLPVPIKDGFNFTGWFTDKTSGKKITEDTIYTYTADTTVYAHWLGKEYTVSFDACGGSVEESDKQVNFDSSYGVLPVPTRTGYTFSGWYDSETGGSLITADSTVNTASDHTLYAHWIVNRYTITFDANGGTVSTVSKTVTFDAAYGSLPTPTRKGYSFTGWYTSADGGDAVNSTDIYCLESDQTLYAHWTANVYTITFNPRGGTVDIESKTVKYGEPYGELPVPIRTGYTFTGWSFGNYPDTFVTSESIYWLTYDKTLFGNWKGNTYKVTFDANGGTVNTNSKNVTFGYTYGDLPTPSKTGYDFVGWYTDPTDGNSIQNNSKVDIASDHTLYARWTAKQLTVKFDANGGYCGTTSKYVYYDSTYGTLPTASRGGYEFLGWFTSKTGGSKVVSTTKCQFTSQKTLYAHWRAIEYTITFNPNGGLLDVASKTVTYDSTYGELPVPTRVGYTFAGWWTSASGGSQKSASSIVDTLSNQTLYAHWNANYYTVKLDPNGGYVSSTSFSVRYDSTYNCLPVPTRTGYRFDGWYTEAQGGDQVKNTDKVTITSELKLYAHWIAGAYTVQFDPKGGVVDPATMTVTYDSAYGTLPTPNREGYSFDGWYSNSSYEDKYKITESTPVKTAFNHNLYAKWTANTYAVSFDVNTGEGTFDDISVTYDAAYGTLPTPSKSGYAFVGWFTSAVGGNEVKSTTIVQTASDHTLYAKWTANTYKVTFDANGGRVTPVSKSCVYDSAYGELPTPTRTGYEFTGWQIKNSTDTVTAESIFRSAGAQTLVAQWEALTYTLKFDPNGGSSDVTEKSITYDSAYGELPVPVKTGYVLVGWFTKKSGGNLVTAEQTVKVTSTTTLYAHWTPVTYTISFDGNGTVDPETALSDVKNTVADMACTYDVSVTLNTNRFARDGYEFISWNTQPDGLGTSYDNGQQVSNLVSVQDGVITLYAQWKQIKAGTPIPTITSMTETDEALPEGTRIYLSSRTDGASVYYVLNSDILDHLDVETGRPDTSDPAVTRFADPIILSPDSALKNDQGQFVLSANGNLIIEISALAIKDNYGVSEVTKLTYYIPNEAADTGDVSEEVIDEIGGPDKIPEYLWIRGVEDRDYTGSAITQEGMEVYYHKILLTRGTDYTVAYSNNTKAGTATVTVNGKGNYSGRISSSFDIKALDLEAVDGNGFFLADALDTSVKYTGRAQKSTTVVTYRVMEDGGKEHTITLKAGTDFTYYYPGTYKNGEEPYDASSFVGNAAEDTSYTVKIIGKGNFTGETTFTQTILAKDSARTSVSALKVSSIPVQTLEYADPEDADSDVKPCEPGKNGTDHADDLIVRNGSTILEEGTDYTLDYANNTTAGTGSVIITGMGDYVGSRVQTFKINGIALNKVTVSGIVGSIPYTGAEIEQPRYDGQGTGYRLSYMASRTAEPIYLIEGRDFEVSYANNTDAAKNKATVIFEGKGLYSGTVKKTFTITPLALNEAVVNAGNLTVEVENPVDYTKGGATPLPAMTYDGRKLVNGVDYTVRYTNNTKVNYIDPSTGSWTDSRYKPVMIVTGRGNYSGTIRREFEITGASLDSGNVSLDVPDVVYKANTVGNCKTTPVLTESNGTKLKAGTDYDTAYKYEYVYNTTITRKAGRNTIETITALAGDTVDMSRDMIPSGAVIRIIVKGKNNYAGSGDVPSTISGQFRIIGTDIAKATVKIPNQMYTGKPIELSRGDLTVTYNKHVLSTDEYEIIPGSYTDNLNKGTASLTIRGLGSYGGTRKVTFKIVDRTMSINVVYDPNNDQATGSVNPNTISDGKKFAKNSYKLNGYAFVGWNTKEDGTGLSFAANEVFKSTGELIASAGGYGGTLRLYAQWAPVEYGITYKLNGGTMQAGNPDTYTICDEIYLHDPEKAGFIFDGWYLDSRCVNKPLYDADLGRCVIRRGTTGRLTLYAKWIRE